ncbi:MAG: hypothetical protein V5A43_04510 [Haloarculaceae archaeon]
MGGLTVEAVETDGRQVRCKCSFSRALRKFFRSDTFWVEYDVDVSDVPAALLVVPVVTTIAPIAWATDTTLHVPVVDEQFAASLEAVKRGYCRLYPEVFAPDRGQLVGERRETGTETGTGGTGLLFTGGVDSQAALLTHMDESPALVAVQGADISLANRRGWDAVTAQVAEAAARAGTTHRTVRSNFRDLLNYYLLDAYFQGPLGRVWWGAVQYQLALPGLCAPLAHAAGYDSVSLASGYTDDPSKPGDQPYIVSALAWGDTTVRMSDVDLTRQEKVALLGRHIRQTGANLTIRSCAADPAGGNCNRCEKCYRTIAALAVEGIDPSGHGFSADVLREVTIRADLEAGAIELDHLERVYWGQVQDRARQGEVAPLAEAAEFVQWLRTVDLDRFEVETKRTPTTDLFYETVRRLPRPLDTALARATGRMRELVTGPAP